MVPSEILQKARRLGPKLSDIYHRLHQIPELAFEEHQTAAFVAHLLAETGCTEIRTGIGGTGITAQVGSGPPLAALRADMDGLPVTEATGLPFSSKHRGKMHACGHDAHMTAVLGAGMLLKEELRNKNGAVKLIFQPAEETPPGGAKEIIAAGELNQDLRAIFGLHCQPQVPTGIVCLKEGPIMAAADMFSITITGQGGHGAMPHQTKDAVLIGSAVVQALQTIVSRAVDPLEPAVVSVGSFHAGSKNNIIADTAVLEGTVRSINPDLRQTLPDLMRQVISGVCTTYGAEYTFDYQWGYPPLFNHAELLAVVEQAAAKVLGTDKVFYADRPSMGSEDFSFYLDKVPGVFFYLGVGTDRHRHPWHHPCFRIDETALPIGAAVLTQAALEVIGG